MRNNLTCLHTCTESGQQYRDPLKTGQQWKIGARFVTAFSLSTYIFPLSVRRCRHDQIILIIELVDAEFNVSSIINLSILKTVRWKSYWNINRYMVVSISSTLWHWNLFRVNRINNKTNGDWFQGQHSSQFSEWCLSTQFKIINTIMMEQFLVTYM